MRPVFRVLCQLGCHWQRRSRLELSTGHVHRYCANCGADIQAVGAATSTSNADRRLTWPTKRFSLTSATIAITALLILIVAPHIDFKGQPADAASSMRLPNVRPQTIGHPGWTDKLAAEMLNTEQPEETR